MRSILLALAVPCVLQAQAEPAAYSPRMRLPNGDQLVVAYIGQTGCGASRDPELKLSIRQMKPLLFRQTDDRPLSIVGIALDWAADSGYAYLKSLGAWDEMIVGNNWVNLGAERHVWRDASGKPNIPQVIVYRRSVTSGDDTIVFGTDSVIKRYIGTAEVIAWVRAGAPVPKATR